ncbi:hypothetical protein SAMN05216589_2687 [Halopseudomonas bauzanensis]|uniref:Uncharacterized protein n=1 Tax=Halopseudomonas bauzanensis TaxID=653930 RepID=A0A1H9VFA3_9GAMM|nr:hypothetical protein SAMN05216589_2687 [Halopseudomonas bauzanensis]
MIGQPAPHAGAGAEEYDKQHNANTMYHQTIRSFP